MSKKKTKKISKNYMNIIFLRNPEMEWNEAKDGIITVDVINKGFHHKIAQKFFRKPRISHITLDQYGSTVWKNLDGTHSVFDLVTIMKEIFPDEEERMLDRVITFLHTLQVNHFITEKTH